MFQAAVFLVGGPCQAQEPARVQAPLPVRKEVERLRFGSVTRPAVERAAREEQTNETESADLTGTR